MPGQQPPLESSRDAVRGNPDQRVDDDRQHDHIGAQELTCIHRKEADAGLGTDGFGHHQRQPCGGERVAYAGQDRGQCARQNDPADQLQRAEAQGLDQAAAYLRLQIREAELARFSSDPVPLQAYLTQVDTLHASTVITMQAYISGTILPSPGNTITDELELLSAALETDLAALPYTIEQAELHDAYAFAARQ